MIRRERCQAQARSESSRQSNGAARRASGTAGPSGQPARARRHHRWFSVSQASVPEPEFRNRSFRNYRLEDRRTGSEKCHHPTNPQWHSQLASATVTGQGPARRECQTVRQTPIRVGLGACLGRTGTATQRANCRDTGKRDAAAAAAAVGFPKLNFSLTIMPPPEQAAATSATG